MVNLSVGIIGHWLLKLMSTCYSYDFQIQHLYKCWVKIYSARKMNIKLNVESLGCGI